MFSRRLVGLVLIVTMLTWGPSAGAVPPVSNSALEDVGLVQYWALDIPVPEGDAVEHAYLVDDSLYVVSAGGVVFSVEARVGLIRWAEVLSQPKVRVFPPSHIYNSTGDGPLLFSTSTMIHIVDRFSGDRLAGFPTGFPRGSAAVGVERVIFVGGLEDRLHALIWQRGESVTSPLWAIKAGPVTAAPVLYGNGHLVFATHAGKVFSCAALDRALDWSFTVGEPVVATPLVDGGGVVVAGSNRILYRLDLDSGQPIWRTRFETPLTKDPIAAGDLVMQPTQDQGLVAVDLDSGEQVWSRPTGETVAGRTEEVTYVFTADGRLEAVESRSGEVRGSISAGRTAMAVTNGANDFVYLLAADGGLVCARPVDVPYLRPAQVNAVKAQLNRPPRDREAAVEVGSDRAEEVDPALADPFRSERDR